MLIFKIKKSMKNIIYTLNFIGLTLLAGCNSDFLDTVPTGALSSEVIWTKDSYAEEAINELYSDIRSECGLQGGVYIYTYYGPDGYNYFRDAAVETGLATTRLNQFYDIYKAHYQTIRTANDIIDHLSGNTDLSTDVINYGLGQAYFHRAISYFYLWQLFGGVVIQDHVMDSDENNSLPRNTAEEVQALIVSDLQKAIELLPVSYSSSSDNGRIAKGAAIAMLGKTYLYQEEWAKSAAEFKLLMTSPYSYALVDDYSKLFDWNYETEAQKENIFALQMVDDVSLGSKLSYWYGIRNINLDGGTYCLPTHTIFANYTHADGSAIDFSTRPKISNYDVSDGEVAYGIDLMNWYQNLLKDKINPMDKRLQVNMICPTDTLVCKLETRKLYWPSQIYGDANPVQITYDWEGYANFLWRKYVLTGYTVTKGSPIDVAIIRYADVLLMYAEAANEVDGPTSDVYSAINLVRERAKINDLPDGLSKDNMRNNIRLERFRELPGEGILYFDLKRWGTATGTDSIFGLNHDELDFRGETLFTRKFPDYYTLLPIPGAELDINPNLTQNPGW
jgi:starch-binding outer membrane protein, SusD/RagB family